MGLIMTYCGMAREYDMVPRATKNIKTFTLEVAARKKEDRAAESAVYVGRLRPRSETFGPHSGTVPRKRLAL